MGGMYSYYVRHSDGFIWHDIYILIQACKQYYAFASATLEAVMLVLLKVGFVKCAVEMGSGSMTHMPSFMKISLGVQAILSVASGNYRL
jgi:uncharacterized protein (DUF983 family)